MFFVLVGVFGQEWGSAEIHTRTFYKAFSSHEIEADIGIKIGLASVNITLKSRSIHWLLSFYCKLTYKVFSIFAFPVVVRRLLFFSTLSLQTILCSLYLLAVLR